MSLKSSKLTSRKDVCEEAEEEEEEEVVVVVVELVELVVLVEEEQGDTSGMLKVSHIRSPSAGIGGAVHGPPDL